MDEKKRSLYEADTSAKDEPADKARQTADARHKRRLALLIVGIVLSAASVIGLSVFLIFSLWSGVSEQVIRHGSGHSEGTAFMSYAGPVFPLTLTEKADGISAERDITLDFSPQTDEESGTSRIWDIGVTDSCVLSNDTASDKTVTVAYPFAGSFNGLDCPSLGADGRRLDASLHAGPYSGGFRGTGDGVTDSMNLDYIDSYEGYSALIGGGNYMPKAFDAYPEPDEPVTVYELTDITDGGSDAENPTLSLDFTMDCDKTIILTYGFNGGSCDPDTGASSRHFSIPKEGFGDYGSPRYLIALGEDIGKYTLQGYKNGGCEPGEEIAGANASVRRYETSLGDILGVLTRAYYDDIHDAKYGGDANRYASPEITYDMYYGEVCDFFSAYGVTGSEAKERYDFGMLEDIISEVNTVDRVFYLTAEVTIPANSSVMLTAEMRKQPSYDHICSGADNLGLMGYDMMTRLGSNLDFASQTASVDNTDGIEIARQNFGFDIAAGVTSVKLDMSQEHYYIEVRELEHGA